MTDLPTSVVYKRIQPSLGRVTRFAIAPSEFEQMVTEFQSSGGYTIQWDENRNLYIVGKGEVIYEYWEPIKN